MDIEKLLQKKIAPKAESIDHSRWALRRAFKQLGRRRLLAVTAPEELKGKNYTPDQYFVFKELVQSYSGALGFFQRQHQAAGVHMRGWEGYQEWLPLMAKGKRKVGVAISHLRNLSHPRLTAYRTDEGYVLNGKVHWASGYKLFDHLLLGFFYDDQEGMGLIPFKRSNALKISKVIPTIALSSVQTVTLQCNQLLIPQQRIVSVRPLGTFNERSSALAVQFSNMSALALACGRLLSDSPFTLYERLFQRHQEVRASFINRKSDEGLMELYGRMYRITRQFLELLTFSKGTQMVIPPNQVERLWREFHLFSVIISSPEIAEACLEP